MKSIPPIYLVAFTAAATAGLMSGLYSLLTRGRRRIVGEIKAEAIRRGWDFRLRRWRGDPTAFQIDGWFRNGLLWVLKTGPNTSDHHGWSVVLGLHIPRLGGAMDFAILPREPRGSGASLPALRLSPRAQSRVAAFSAAAADAAGFFRDAQETPSGFENFDNAYKILTLKGGILGSPNIPTLARDCSNWPQGTIVPKEILAWRDPFGVHVQAHLPGVPNLTTITHFLDIAEDFCARLPTPIPSKNAPPSIWDRLLVRLLDL